MRRAFNPLETLGYLAIWMGLYVVAYACAFSAIAGVSLNPMTGAALFTTTVAVYLLDRIELRALNLPEQAETHPRRSKFLRNHPRLVSALLITALVSAILTSALIHPFASAAPALAAMGVVIYARIGSPGKRLRDRLVIKNLTVAASVGAIIILFLGLQTLLDQEAFAEFVSVETLIALLFVVVAVAIDAMLCDVPDVEADRSAGGRTIPMLLGPRAAWRLAIAAAALLALIFIPAGMALTSNATPIIVWTMLNLVGVALLRLAQVTHLRDLCDLKAPIIAIIWLTIA